MLRRNGVSCAGASFPRLDGRVWTTDKDGITAALLAAEMTGRTGQDPGEIYRALTAELGDPMYARTEVPATPEEQRALQALSPADVRFAELAGEPIREVVNTAAGNNHPIGGIKVVAPSGWFAVRPSGTESVYKVYAESFRGPAHLERIQTDATAIVSAALASSEPDAPATRS